MIIIDEKDNSITICGEEIIWKCKKGPDWSVLQNISFFRLTDNNISVQTTDCSKWLTRGNKK